MSDEQVEQQAITVVFPTRTADLVGRINSSMNGDEQVEQQAITVGGTIVATTTIDAIMTSLFPTRTADLVGTPTYTWVANGPPLLAATWPAATSQSGPCVQLLARFEVHSVLPSAAGP